jgi:hypothetical protein
MRALVFAAVLLGTSSLSPSFAQNQGNSPPAAQPQTVPVQPERSPQQSDQSREQDQKRAEDVRVRPGWRTQDADRTDRMGENDTGRMREQMRGDRDWDRRTVGRSWRMGPDEDRADRDEYRRNYYDRDQPRRRVKVCVEYADGDEYCRYRD